MSLSTKSVHWETIERMTVEKDSIAVEVITEAVDYCIEEGYEIINIVPSDNGGVNVVGEKITRNTWLTGTNVLHI